MTRVVLVVGTRPEAIKLGPLVPRFREADMDPVVITTGQHREMVDEILPLWSAWPEYDLGLLQPGQSLASLTSRALSGLGTFFEELTPRAVVVQGDTSTALAGALAAFYSGVPVAHVEAGLRTDDPTSPFPEEMNRRLISRLARLHLAPTLGAQGNLLREGTDPDAIVVTGNTVIDALLQAVELDPPESSVLARMRSHGGPTVLVTTHRRESWGGGIQRIALALERLARRDPEILVVLPMHPNPRVRNSLLAVLQQLPNVLLTEPQPYHIFAHMMDAADLLLTDSGGIQEEGPALGKPVLVMRENTERPEAIDAGTAILVGTDVGTIVSEVRDLLASPDRYERMSRAVNPFGDGQASQRTVAAIRHLLANSPRPADFVADVSPPPVDTR